jgi:hypothetical protein
VRALKKFVQDSQFEHHFQGGRVNRIAAKIPEEVAVFFEDARINTGTS